MASRRGFLQLTDNMHQCSAPLKLPRDSSEEQVACGHHSVTLGDLFIQRALGRGCLEAFEHQRVSHRCIQLNDFKQVIGLLVFCFLHLKYVADDICPVGKQRTVWIVHDYINT